MNSNNENYDINVSLQKAHELYKINSFADATPIVDQILLDYPSCAEALQLKALIAWGCHNSEDAILLIKKAIEADPLQVRYYYNLGTVCQQSGRISEAELAYRQALKIDPNHIGSLNNLSSLLTFSGMVSECEVLARQAIQNNPDHCEPYTNLGNALAQQGKIDEAIEAYKKSLEIKPSYLNALSNLLLTVNYSEHYNSHDAFQVHKWGGEQYKRFLTFKNVCVKSAPSSVPIRVCYVSADFRNHAVARFFEPIISNHDRKSFEVYCYYNGIISDQVTERIKSNVAGWRDIRNSDDSIVAEMVRKDQIDILIDLSGHTAENRLTLFAQRVAPVQLTYLGYPNTTGLDTIDYRITDRWADPPEQQQYNTEALLYMDNGFLVYKPQDTSPAINELPALSNGYITFGSFNNLSKITASVISLWSKVLLAVPQSRLMLKNRSFADSNVRERYLQAFVSNGISNERLTLLAPVQDESRHLLTYNSIDIALDTFPYNGTTTTCESLWMGVPVITLEGDHHGARVGVSLLSRMGLSSFIAKSTEHYVGIASWLSTDVQRLSGLRHGLRGAMWNSPICNAKVFVEEFEKKLLECVIKKR